ncbi:MAG: ribonuclease E/G, partial [Pseudomonadota bacterium]
HAIIEVAGAAQAAPAAAPAQQSLQLDTPAAAPLPGAVTAKPAEVLADLAASRADLQQVETQGAAAPADTGIEMERPRRRRRPVTRVEAEPVSLMQVETTAPAAPVAEAAPAPATPHPTRRRQRPQVPTALEPLVQVETRAD